MITATRAGRSRSAGIAHRDRGGAQESLFGGGSIGLRGPCDAGEHRSGVAMQDLLARFLADLRFRERLPGPVAAELGAVGAAHDALGAVQTAPPPRSRAGRTSCNRRTPSPCGSATTAAPHAACRAGSGGPCARPRREGCRPDCGPGSSRRGSPRGQSVRHNVTITEDRLACMSSVPLRRRALSVSLATLGKASPGRGP